MQDDRVEHLPSDATKRNVVAKVTRDEMGFVTSEQPNFSLDQVKFLLALATYHDVVRASEESDVEMAQVAAWMNDAEFLGAFNEFIQNKREGVKQMGSQIAPMMLWTLTTIMETGNNKERLSAVKLLAQMQGLLINRNTVVDASALEQLRERLMQPRPIYKELTNGA